MYGFHSSIKARRLTEDEINRLTYFNGGQNVSLKMEEEDFTRVYFGTNEIIAIIANKIPGRLAFDIKEMGDKCSSKIKNNLEKLRNSIKTIYRETKTLPNVEKLGIKIDENEDIHILAISSIFIPDPKNDEDEIADAWITQISNLIPHTNGKKESFLDKNPKVLKKGYTGIEVSYILGDKKKIFKVSNDETIKNEFKTLTRASKKLYGIPDRNEFLVELRQDEIKKFNLINGRDMRVLSDPEDEEYGNYLSLKIEEEGVYGQVDETMKVYGLCLDYVNGITLQKFIRNGNLRGQLLIDFKKNIPKILETIYLLYHDFGIFSENISDETIIVDKNGDINLTDIIDTSTSEDSLNIFNSSFYYICTIFANIIEKTKEFENRFSEFYDNISEHIEEILDFFQN